jgi:hypothetical protein
VPGIRNLRLRNVSQIAREIPHSHIALLLH